MGVTSYLTVNGEVLSETRSGVEEDYIPDPLGSTAALVNPSQVITDTFTYWPYGELRNHVGSSVTPLQYLGTIGYYTNSVGGTIYVRARFLNASTTHWTTQDPIWPSELAYAYADASPASCSDGSGMSSDDPILSNIKKNLGKGAKECNWWLQGVLRGAGIKPPDGVANTWADYCRSHPEEWQEVPNDGHSPGPTCIICTNRVGMGHVEIIDGNCMRVSASHHKRNGKIIKRIPQGKPIRDLDPKGDGEITVWRHIPKKKKKC